MTAAEMTGVLGSSGMSVLFDTLGDNIMFLLIMLAVMVTLIAALRTWDVIHKHRSNIKLDELEGKRDKLERFAKTQKRKALRDAMVMLKPDERGYIYSLWDDNSIVSRKAIFKLNELEGRISRAEKGAEVRWAEGRIDGLRSTERKIFPEAYRGREGKSK